MTDSMAQLAASVLVFAQNLEHLSDQDALDELRQQIDKTINSTHNMDQAALKSVRSMRD